MKMMRQLSLASGELHLVTWVEDRPGLVISNKITLKDYKEPDREWMIMLVGPLQKASDIKRGWDNNV